MAKFITLKADGKTIWMRGRCPDADVAIQPLPPGGSIVAFPDSAVIPDGDVEWDGAGQTFVPSMSGAKRRQGDAIKAGAYNYIQGSFTSSAKGSPLIYDTGTTEQTNMLLSAFGGGGLMAKASVGGVFAPVAHTQAQARQVVADFVSYRDAALAKLAALGNQIRNANTVADVLSVTWSPPP